MAEKENTFLSANHLYEEVEGESGKALTLEEDQQRNLIGIIKGRFAQAEDARQTDERRWLRAYENYRGLYAKNLKFRESEKSRVFVKVTKTKVLAAFGQLVDVIFGTGKFPIGVSETKVPEGETNIAHLDINNPTPGLETSEAEIPDDIKDNVEIITVSFVEDVINHALVTKPKPIKEIKNAIPSQIDPKPVSDVGTAH